MVILFHDAQEWRNAKLFQIESRDCNINSFNDQIRTL